MSASDRLYMKYKDMIDFDNLPASILGMDNFHPVSPLRLGHSKSADPEKPSILDLPGELRNQIFAYLVTFPFPVNVEFGTHYRMFLRRADRLRFATWLFPPIDLFRSCRTLYREAGTMLYSNNTFLFSRYFPNEHNEQDLPGSLVEIPREFFSRLGSQAHWLRSIVLDLDQLQPMNCFRGEARLDHSFEAREAVFDEKLELFEVTPLLRAIWRLNADVDVTFTQSFGPLNVHDKKYVQYHASSLTAVMRSILQGQLKLRQYGRLVAAVGIRRDASGGIINWGTTNYDLRGGHPQRIRVLPGPEHMSTFVAEDDGSRLKLVSSNQANLLALPGRLRERIFNMVVTPVEGISIDLDKETKFNCGLLHTNQEIYQRWRSSFLYQNNFVLTTTTTTSDTRTTFDNFDKLRQFLRKTYKFIGYGGHESTTTIGTGGHSRRGTGVIYILKFDLNRPATLSDIRIKILPFVMETSTTSPSQEVTIQIWAPTPGGSSAMTASHTITLRKLRLDVVKAILDYAFAGPYDCNPYLPDFWINGFGEVVETLDRSGEDTGSAWKPASELVFSPIYHSVVNLHPIDRNYRGCEVNPRCDFYETKQFFPFRGKTEEVLPYLMSTMEPYPWFFKK
ncbi:hypothetical protein J4E85_008991 [Alternaria conjuncta]|uniref:uncharacterized protein n=1 Tax=Alternaria conjuncta TaxID=181017 RepID=UPI00221FFC34|nr:uncharacterized protein J4E85_008991 [Alternaria conjuncta]KAI4920876.1 hypothetical protein J4E85_008991 [Alternaria conjuncta]